jgi:hypothetical protein
MSTAPPLELGVGHAWSLDDYTWDPYALEAAPAALRAGTEQGSAGSGLLGSSTLEGSGSGTRGASASGGDCSADDAEFLPDAPRALGAAPRPPGRPRGAAARAPRGAGCKVPGCGAGLAAAKRYYQRRVRLLP